ncbi:hypothetical protein OCU04_012148 [Sclerotinia nivalis]|nr:hypothetical protein OCU04_012148 [Sclerotinia nivalis]
MLALLSQPPLSGVETSNTIASPLFKLPIEVRRIVFEHVLLEHPEWSITTWTTNGDKSLRYFDTKTKETIDQRRAKPQVQVPRICRAINTECQDIIWKHRAFVWLQTSDFYRLCHQNNDAFKLDRMETISNVELMFDYTLYKRESLVWCYILGKCLTPAQMTNKWQNLKRMKVYLYNSHTDENNVYGHFSPEVMKRVRNPKNHQLGEDNFILLLRLLKMAVERRWFPDHIPQADGSRREVERILDFDFKWDAYHDTVHERNWSTISDILKACHTAFGGGELWAGGVLCWKNKVMQAHMRSIKDLRTYIINKDSPTGNNSITNGLRDFRKLRMHGTMFASAND